MYKRGNGALLEAATHGYGACREAHEAHRHGSPRVATRLQQLAGQELAHLQGARHGALQEVPELVQEHLKNAAKPWIFNDFQGRVE